MDLEVASMDTSDNSLSIDYDATATGFSLFYITFEGSLSMKNGEAAKCFKLSFMVEGQIVRETDASSPKHGEVKETIITVAATKMDVQQ